MKMSKNRKIAVLEVMFDPDIMFDEVTLENEFGGDWLKAMQWLYGEEGTGVFYETPKLVEIKELQNNKKGE